MPTTRTARRAASSSLARGTDQHRGQLRLARPRLHPSADHGAYTFWIASDDAGDLLLSTNDSPANATRIAFVSEWTDSRAVDQVTSQRSASDQPGRGQKYYIEVLQKEATGGTTWRSSWQGPGIAQP
jgi:hypothetical protein